MYVKCRQACASLWVQPQRCSGMLPVVCAACLPSDPVCAFARLYCYTRCARSVLQTCIPFQLVGPLQGGAHSCCATKARLGMPAGPVPRSVFLGCRYPCLPCAHIRESVALLHMLWACRTALFHASLSQYPTAALPLLPVTRPFAWAQAAAGCQGQGRPRA